MKEALIHTHFELKLHADPSEIGQLSPLICSTVHACITEFANLSALGYTVVDPLIVINGGRYGWVAS